MSGGKYLLGFESGRDPGVLLQRAARVVVRGGVPLEFVHELGDRLLHLHGHGRHCMLLTATLAVRADLPEGGHRGQGGGPVRPARFPVLLKGYETHLCTLEAEVYEHRVKTNARLINHSRGARIALEAIEFLQKQDVTLRSLFGNAVNHTMKTGPRALLFPQRKTSSNC